MKISHEEFERERLRLQQMFPGARIEPRFINRAAVSRKKFLEKKHGN